MGQRVVITGSHPVLGSWDPSRSKVELATDAASYPCWTGALAAPTGTDVLFKIAVLDRDGRVHWEDRVRDRTLGFPATDVQLSVEFNDARMETTRIAPAGRPDEDPARQPDPREARQSPRAAAEPQGSREPHELDRLLREALLRTAEAGRRAEIAESRARRSERLIQDADVRTAAAERMAAELQAKLALDELQGERADLVREVRAEVRPQKVEQAVHAARALRYAGYSPDSEDARVFRRNISCSSAASSTCYASDCGWVPASPADSSCA